MLTKHNITCQQPKHILVLHVKNGYDDRKAHIDKMMEEWGFNFHYILDGDKSDLTQERFDRYFAESMKVADAVTSCCMKHFLAYEYIKENCPEGALIVEDDMIFYKNFAKVFGECMEEIETRGIKNALFSFEDSTLQFVKGSERIKGQHLYKKNKDRFTGCFFCMQETAKSILDYIEKNKCDIAIDLFHTKLEHEGVIEYYWCDPCIATQGSHVGLFPSSINEKSAKKQTYRKYTWGLKLAYKKLLYRLR